MSILAGFNSPLAVLLQPPVVSLVLSCKNQPHVGGFQLTMALVALLGVIAAAGEWIYANKISKETGE